MATSGTTSQLSFPKRWIAHTRESLRVSARSVCEWLDVSPQDRWARILPRTHMGGLSLDVRSEVSGCTIIDGPPGQNLRWNPKEIADWLEKERATLVSAVPAQIWDWVQAKIPAPSPLRGVIVGGDRLDLNLADQAVALGWPLLKSYGMTETASMIACDREAANRSEWIPLLPHVQAERSSDGCLTLTSQALFTAELVWNKSINQYKLFNINNSQSSWTASDQVEIRGRSLRVVGRSDEQIKINGQAIDLGTLDLKLAEILRANHLQFSAVFFDIPDPRSGCRIAIVVDGESGKSAGEMLLKLWNTSCSSLEKASQVYWLPKLPRTDLGKLKRAQIRSLIPSLV